MDFSSITTMSSFTRNMRLQTQWNIKKSKGAYTQKADEGKKSSNVDVTNSDAKTQEAKEENAKKQVVDKLAPYREELDRMRDSKDVDAEVIYLKVQSGKKLSSKEMEYLAKKDPQTYQKVKQMQMDQAAFERKLKQCKTKEEVQRLKTNYVAQSLHSVNSIMNNAVIPKDKKFELVMQEHAKFQLILETEHEFVESGEYQRLQTEQELNQSIREENERSEEILHGKEPEEILPEAQGDIQAENMRPEDTQAENTRPKNTQSGNTQPGNTQPGNTQSENTRPDKSGSERDSLDIRQEKSRQVESERDKSENHKNTNASKAHQGYREIEAMDLDLEIETAQRKGKLRRKV